MKIRDVNTKVVIASLALLACSTAAIAQDNRGGNALDNTLYTKLNRADPSSGGPAPKHDLTGYWAGPLVATKGDDIPPMTAMGKQRYSLNKPEVNFGTKGGNDPLKTCDPLGLPRNLIFETRGMAFSTMPNKLVILHQYQRVWRDVWMDGRSLPTNVDAKGGPESMWYGYSVGHWDGDNILVIDTVGSDDRSWLDTAGHPHSVDAHVQERYTRVDHNHMELTVTVDDPKIYTKPFVLGTLKFRWIPAQEMEQQMCIPSEAIDYSNIIAIPAGR